MPVEIQQIGFLPVVLTKHEEDPNLWRAALRFRLYLFYELFVLLPYDASSCPSCEPTKTVVIRIPLSVVETKQECNED